MKKIPYLVSLATAFVAGYLLPRPNPPVRTTVSTMPPEPARTAPVTEVAQVAPREKPDRSAAAASISMLSLSRETVSALLVGGSFSARLQRLGVDETRTAEVARIRTSAIESLKALEKQHARAVTDEKGAYVVVEAFPDARRDWLENMERELRTLFGDDRAAVVASMISTADNDEDPGSRRREIFVTPGDADGKLRIEERVFDDAGRHIDSDYEVVDDRSRSRWGHLLE